MLLETNEISDWTSRYVDELMIECWREKSKTNIDQLQKDVFKSFEISEVKHDNSQEQAGTGGTHQPELTIFLAFYFTMGEHMEEESGH